jgi:DNA-binding transcriptional MerR regulator
VAKIYILKEPQYLRDQVVETITFLRFFGFYSDQGEEISPITAEHAARYDRILEQIAEGVPLSQIAELTEIFNELREAEERRKLFREYKKRLRAFSLSLTSQNRMPTQGEVMGLLELIQTGPLAKAVSSDFELSRLIEVLKPHPNLAGDEYIDCRFIRHLLATDFADEFYLAKFWESLRIRYADGKADIRLQNGYAVDFPKRLAISGSAFCFTGKFQFGPRNKCREAVLRRGGTWISSATGGMDFLVIAANGENTSPTSTKVSSCMDLKSKGYPCFMLTEEFWLAHLDETVSLPEVRGVDGRRRI